MTQSRFLQLPTQQRVLLMNAARQEKRRIHYQELIHQAQIEFHSLKKDRLFLTALSLYWGEGSKTHNGRVSVVNSDPGILKIIVRFYREVLSVPEEKIRAEMFIYQDIDESHAKKYWSRQLGVTTNQFIKTQVLPSRSLHTKRKVPYGLCTVYFSNTDIGIKILEWIRLLAEECGNSSVG